MSRRLSGPSLARAAAISASISPTSSSLGRRRPWRGRSICAEGSSRAAALEEEEAEILADRREPPGGGRGQQARAGQRRQIGADVVAAGRRQALAAPGEEAREVGEVAAVGVERVARGTALGRHHLEEGVERAGSQAQGPAGAGGERARIALQAQREQGVERTAQGDGRRRLRPAVEQEEHEQERGSPLLLQARRARSRATGTGSAAVRAPRPAVWRSSFQTGIGNRQAEPVDQCRPAGALLGRNARPRPRPSRRGRRRSARSGSTGPGAAGATTAARAAEARPGLSATALRAGTGRLATAAASRSSGTERSSGRSSASSATGGRSVKRVPATAARARPARFGSAAMSKASRRSSPSSTAVASRASAAQTTRGLGPWRALGGRGTARPRRRVRPARPRTAPAAGAHRAPADADRRRLRQQLQRGLGLAHRQQPVDAQARSASGAASAGPGAASRARCSSRKVGSSIAVGSRRSRSAMLGRRASGPERAGELRLRAGQARGQRCRRRQVLHADRRCGLARTRPEAGGRLGREQRARRLLASGRQAHQPGCQGEPAQDGGAA